MRCIALVVSAIVTLLGGATSAAGQEMATAPQTVYTCGHLTFMLETTDVETWGICEHSEILYLVGYCNDFQRFEITARADSQMKASAEWHCQPEPGYMLDIACDLFPGWLHFTLKSKSSNLWSEVYCPPVA